SKSSSTVVARSASHDPVAPDPPAASRNVQVSAMPGRCGVTSCSSSADVDRYHQCRSPAATIRWYSSSSTSPILACQGLYHRGMQPGTHLSSPTCVVTGGLGFIGSNLVHELFARGATVRIIDALVEGH